MAAVSEREDEDDDMFGNMPSSVISYEHFNLMYFVLEKLARNKDANVRKDVFTHALAHIQNESAVISDMENARMPKEVLYEHLFDPNPFCRLEVVRHFKFTEADHKKQLIRLSLEDDDEKVQAEALKKIILMDFKTWSNLDRSKLLCAMGTETDPKFCDEYKKLATKWLQTACHLHDDAKYSTDTALAYKAVCAATLYILPRVYIRKHEEDLEKILPYLFHVCHSMKYKQSYFDFLREMLSEENSGVICKENYTDILEKDVSLPNMLNVRHWRCLVEYLAKVVKNEGERSHCLARLLPTMLAFVRFVRSTVERFCHSFESAEQTRAKKVKYFYHKCLFDMFVLLRFIEREPVGMAEWKTLLVKDILCNQSIPLDDEKLFEIIITSLVQMHYSDGSCEEFGNDFCDILNNILKWDANTDNLLGNAAAQFAIKSDDSDVIEMSSEVRHRCLYITNAVLRATCLNGFTALQTQLFDSVITPSLGSETTKERALAYQCVGCLCVLNQAFAQKQTSWFNVALNIESFELQEICVDITTEIILQFGYEAAEQWFTKDDGERTQPYALIKIYVDRLKHQNVQLALSSLNGLCRFLLTFEADSQPMPQVLALLLVLRCKSLATPPLARTQKDEIVEYFFDLFLEKHHQQVALINVIDEAITCLDKDNGTFAPVKPMDVCLFVVELTRPKRMQSLENAGKIYAHGLFAEKALNHLNDPCMNEENLAFWSKVLMRLAISPELEPKHLTKIHELCQTALLNVGEYSGAWKNVTSFTTRVMNVLNVSNGNGKRLSSSRCSVQDNSKRIRIA